MLHLPAKLLHMLRAKQGLNVGQQTSTQLGSPPKCAVGVMDLQIAGGNLSLELSPLQWILESAYTFSSDKMYCYF
jgi:hypothetical protein